MYDGYYCGHETTSEAIQWLLENGGVRDIRLMPSHGTMECYEITGVPIGTNEYSRIVCGLIYWTVVQNILTGEYEDDEPLFETWGVHFNYNGAYGW